MDLVHLYQRTRPVTGVYSNCALIFKS